MSEDVPSEQQIQAHNIPLLLVKRRGTSDGRPIDGYEDVADTEVAEAIRRVGTSFDMAEQAPGTILAASDIKMPLRRALARELQRLVWDRQDSADVAALPDNEHRQAPDPEVLAEANRLGLSIVALTVRRACDLSGEADASVGHAADSDSCDVTGGFKVTERLDGVVVDHFAPGC